MKEASACDPYLRRLGARGNFWSTPEYCARAGFSLHEDPEGYWIKDGEGHLVFPGLSRVDLNWTREPVEGGVYCDFGEVITPLFHRKDLWDREYIYNAGEVAALEGKGHRTTRKNLAKFREEFPHASFDPFPHQFRHYTELPPSARFVVQDWAERAQGDTLEDFATIESFLCEGDHRWVVRDPVEILAIIAADRYLPGAPWDWAFRVCMVRRDVPGLSEFARWNFFQAVARDRPRCKVLVNDGGDLGSESLAAFKRRLRPTEILKTWSWIDVQEEQETGTGGAEREA